MHFLFLVLNPGSSALIDSRFYPALMATPSPPAVPASTSASDERLRAAEAAHDIREPGAKASRFPSKLEEEAAMARLDPDGRVLRVALRMPARAHVSRSYNVIAIDLLPPETEDPPDIVSPREQSEIEAAAAGRWR